MSETLTLDPFEECPDRIEVDLTPYVGGAGPDFGDTAIEAFRSQANVGESVIDFRMPNRTITIPLVVHGRTGLSFDELRSALQSKVGLFQREGGVLKRETSIGPVYADIQTAALKLGGSTAQALYDVDADAVLTLEVTPDWYGEEIDLASESGTGEVIRVLTPDRGDHPGPVRIVVTDTAGVARNAGFWGERSRHYDASATAALAYEAESLTPLDAAAIATVTGASGGGSNNVVRHASLGTTWTPVLLTDIVPTGPLTHTGSYRVWARAYSTSAIPPRVRLAWDVGDLTNPIANTPVTIPGPSAFYIVDLGEVRIDPAPLGTHRWRGMVQAVGATGGENVSIDRLWLQPLDEYAGTLRAPVVAEPGLQAYVARDEFNQTSGALNAKTLPVGGAWATSGDTGDLQVSGSGGCSRATTGPTNPVRRALAGSTDYAAVAVQADLSSTAWDDLDILTGLLLRYVDTNNYVDVLRAEDGIFLDVIVAGSTVAQAHLTAPQDAIAATIKAYIDADGRFFVWAGTGQSLGAPILVGQHSSLATGGALEDGKVGLFDANASSTAATRTYDNFAAWVPEADAVAHANQALEIRTDGAVRENPTGGGYGPVSWVLGDLPRLPAPGLESRETELLVVLSRGDLADIPDAARTDTFTVQVHYRPSYLYVPDGGPGS